jgi:hypothetical protein
LATQELAEAPIASPSKPGIAHHLKNLAGHIANAPSHVQEKYHSLKDSSKKALASWHAKTPVEKAKHVASTLAHTGKSLVHHTVQHVKHEAHMYHGAGKAISHLASGKKWKDLEPHHKKHLRNALIHAGITATGMAMGDPTGGHAHGSIASTIAQFAHEHVHHMGVLGGGEVGLKTAKDATKKVLTASAFNLEKLRQSVVKILVAADIPPEECVHILSEIEKEVKMSKPKRK